MFKKGGTLAELLVNNTRERGKTGFPVGSYPVGMGAYHPMGRGFGGLVGLVSVNSLRHSCADVLNGSVTLPSGDPGGCCSASLV